MALPSSFVDAPTDIYEHPYSVVKHYDFYGETYTGAYQASFSIDIPEYNGMGTALQMLAGTVESAAEYESIKEKKLFDAFKDQLPKGSNLRKDFESFIDNNNYSKAFDIYMKFSQGIYDFNATFEENKERFSKKNNLFLTKRFLAALADSLKRSSQNPSDKASFGAMDLSTITANDMIDELINNVKEGALKENLNLKKEEEAAYDNYLMAMKSYIKSIFGEAFPDIISSIGDPYDFPLSQLETSKWVKTKRKESKYSNVPLNRLLWNNISGALGGMGLEVYLDFSGGVKTGKVTDKGLNIKTDVIMLANAKGTLLVDDNEIKQELINIVNNKEKATKENLDNFLNSDKLKNNFIIMISAKDQSTSKSFSNYHATNQIKMAESTTSLNKRMEDIREFGNAAGIMGSGISDLMFALVNLESDMYCAGETGLVKGALGALCANWMFDDVAETFDSVPAVLGPEDDATKIYVYNVSGAYYTLSDILRKTAERIRQNVNSQMVSVQFHLSKGSYDLAKSVPAGLERWKKVNENVMANTTFGFKLNSNNLFKQLFNSKV